MPEHTGDLGAVLVESSSGEQVALGHYWRDRPAVLVFLRHFG